MSKPRGRIKANVLNHFLLSQLQISFVIIILFYFFTFLTIPVSLSILWLTECLLHARCFKCILHLILGMLKGGSICNSLVRKTETMLGASNLACFYVYDIENQLQMW